MIVALYARVSTDDQNVKQQKELLVKYCQTRGWEYRSYVDEAVSGSVSDRVAWQKLMRDCEKEKFDGILALNIDRITRTLSYAVEFHSWLMGQKDLSLIMVYESIDLSTHNGWLNFMINAMLAEYELKKLDDRRRIGIERAKKEGKYKGGKKGRKKKRLRGKE